MRTRYVDVEAHIEQLILVSDLHGFIEPLEALDEILAATGDPVRVLVVGDIFDGGATPVETLEWVRAHAGELAVLGNHDEIRLDGTEDDHPSFTDVGAFQRLNGGQLEYLRGLPDVLALTWKGLRIRVLHGHRTLSGEPFSWRSRPSQVVEAFADPTVSLTVVGHTHYPFVVEQDGTMVANCGSVSMLLFGLRRRDGTILPQGDETTFAPVEEIYSTYLSLTVEDGELQATLRRFDYDRQRAIGRLREAEYPLIEDQTFLIEKGLYST